MLDRRQAATAFSERRDSRYIRNGLGTSAEWQTSGPFAIFPNENGEFLRLALLFRDHFETAECPCISMAISRERARP